MRDFLRNIVHFLGSSRRTYHLDYADHIDVRYNVPRKQLKLLYAQIDQYRSNYAELLRAFLQYTADLLEIPLEKNNASGIYWNNGYLPGLDIVTLYGMIREHRPHRYVEIGSGYSTWTVHRARMDGQTGLHITSIDPEPRSHVSTISDEVHRVGLENLDLSVLDVLEAGDMLFLDGSHRLLPNSDCTVFFMEVLPRLRPGVLVHVHDVYLPYDYPKFMVDRLYNEQYALAIFLQQSSSEIVLPNYFISQDEVLAEIIAPIWQGDMMASVEQHGGSFWFKVG
ncbi:MAG: class I SAM-dependent methyltransferase [Bacteroidota bacterium]